MHLNRVHNQSREGGFEDFKPLMGDGGSARKAAFKKLHRHGAGCGKNVRIRRAGYMVRGNSFAGNFHGQRVVVKLNPVKNRTKGVGVGAGSGAANLRAHVNYISRNRAGKEGEKAVLFDAEVSGVDGKDFFELCKNDRHHFRMIISPEHGHDINDFEGYVRQVMGRVERDLGTQLEWVSAVHYDTDDVHAHVIIRGKTDRGQDLVIGRDYISAGMRGRAQEVATELLGERSLDEIQKSMERDVDAFRVTSLDRFIAKQARKVDGRRVVDVRLNNNFGKSAHYEGLIKVRLRYLAGSGLAVESPPGVFALKDGYQETLRQVAERGDVIKKLYGRVDAGLDDIALYSIKAGEGQVVEGRVIDKGLADELSDRKYMVVSDMAEKLHYVPVGENARYDEVGVGSLVRIRAGDQSTGRADHNIDMVARKNDEIYDPDLHMRSIAADQSYIAAEERAGYLKAHTDRLETLEANNIVEPLGGGLYRVPSDVKERGRAVTAEINARQNKRFYPYIDVISADPLPKQVNLVKKTWLDKELYKQAKGKPSFAQYDALTASALEDRKSWLIDQGLGFIQSNGTFGLRDQALFKLSRMEITRAGEMLAKDFGLGYNRKRVLKEETVYQYAGHITLESGAWAVVAEGKSYCLPIWSRAFLRQSSRVSA